MSLAGGSFTSLALAFDDVNAPFNGANALETFELPADLGNLLAGWPANGGMLSVGVGSLGSLGLVASVRAGAPEDVLRACVLCLAPRPHAPTHRTARHPCDACTVFWPQLTAPQLAGMGMPELIELDIPGQLATFDALGVLDEVCQLLYLGVGGAACSP